MTPMTLRALVLASIAAAGFASGCGGTDPAPAASARDGAVPVTTTAAVLAEVPAVVEAGGIVRARLVAPISSRVLAPIARVDVRPGDRVRAGQPLVTLDASQLEADRRRAAAALAAAEKSVTAADADVRGADASLVLARATRDRIVTLFERRSATAQERDEADAGFAAAEARAAGARARTAEAAAAVDAARAAADAAAIAASYAVLAAPFDGVVSERHADPGMMAAPGAPLLTVEDESRLQLEVRLDEARAANVATGQPVDVAFDLRPIDDAAPPPAAGRVSEIGRLDPSSHSFLVKIDLPAGLPLKSGMFGRAAFAGPSRRTLMVPASAVVRRGQMAFVFTVADGRARMRPVSTGEAAASTLEITAGLSAGEAVVTSPPASLLDGAAVRVTASGGPR